MTPSPPVHSRPSAGVPQQDIDHILQHTGALWNQVRGSQLFVTGGTGFFGHWLLESFLAANAAFRLEAGVTVLTRSPERFRTHSPHLANHPAVTLLAGDIQTFAFPPGRFSCIIHAATEAVERETHGATATFSAIVEGTRHCLAFARACGAERFLLTSSGAVYGPQPAELSHIPEAYRGAPDAASASSAYGEGKRAAELLCALAAEDFGLECMIARCFAFVGPHLPLDAHFAVGNFIRDVLLGEPVRIQGDGTARRSYLYAADLAVWLWAILFAGPPLTPINVGSDQDLSILELAQTVVDTLAPGHPIQVARSRVPGAPPHRYVPAVTAAQQRLGLRQRVDLADAIARTAAWYGWRASR
jgi:nucleoside-diphosphate-sugar epimerase